MKAKVGNCCGAGVALTSSWSASCAMAIEAVAAVGAIAMGRCIGLSLSLVKRRWMRGSDNVKLDLDGVPTYFKYSGCTTSKWW